MKIFIYGLYDVMDPKQTITYVGKTKCLDRRLFWHLTPSRPVGRWILELNKTGSHFGWKVLEVVEENEATKKEAGWILELAPRLNGQHYPEPEKRYYPDVHNFEILRLLRV